MTTERLSELRELIYHLDKTLAPLVWDAGRNQINEFKKVELGKLQVQRESLQKELNDIEQKNKESD